MITTEYPPHLLDPERLCTCKHRYSGHDTDPRYRFDADNPTASPHAGGCTRCRCPKFVDRVAWRIEYEPCAGLFPARWRVVSPSGRRLWSCPGPTAAYQIAHSMAALDELMARVARLEGDAFGSDPRLQLPARRPPKPKIQGLEVVR